MWPAIMVQQLVPQLPKNFTAEPRVHLGSYFEQYAYEVLVYDQSHSRKLVAAVEIVSPANKDRPENRVAFATKCAALLQQHVCVAIVDLVTTRNFNLYCELFSVLKQTESVFSKPAPNIYAAVCRGRKIGSKPHLDTWAYPFAVGQPLPSLPLWLTDDFAIALDLEAAYEMTCRILRIE